MITREQARAVLEQYAETWLTGHALGATDAIGPLIFLGDEDTPFAHMARLRDEDDGKSAYHLARAVHDSVLSLGASSLTVCMFAYKVIQGIKYHGWILYHVDDEGETHTRILDPERGLHWILDRSPYWKPFPYTFGDGPHEMPPILGRHEEPVDNPDFDELLRP